ncbi:MAG: hypothetical protein R2909_11460 [Gemmatimonadales bacterium]
MSLIRNRLARLFPAEVSDQVHFGIVLAWLLAAGGVLGLVVLVAALSQGWIGPLGFVLGLLLLPVALYGLARVVFWAVGRASWAFGHVVLAGGNLTPAPSFSAEEAMVMQGRIEDARLALESRLAENPDDLAVRLHLAALVRDRQADYSAAERLYLEGRSRPGADARADTFANLLIDLYQKTGSRGRLIVELARYAERHRGSPAGLAARRRLDELKAEIQADSG